MKKERIMINGTKYRYIINSSNEIETAKPVSKEILDLIKQTLIKKGKYHENSSNVIEEKEWKEEHLKTRFQKWAVVELKMYRDELEKRDLNRSEELILKMINKEIERRS